MIDPIVINNVNLPTNFVRCYLNDEWVNIGILIQLFEKINTVVSNMSSVLLDSFSVHINALTVAFANEKIFSNHISKHNRQISATGC